jgi:putative transposase
MGDYRRAWVPGGTFFFTVVTANRAPILNQRSARQYLRLAFRATRRRFPFAIEAIVLLPDHLHAMWTLCPGDSAYSTRWALIKLNFTRQWLAGGGSEQSVSRAKRSRRHRGVWQPRFWEHTIRDELDFERHFDYIHYNPVKHGLVSSAAEWPYSSFHRAVRLGIYPTHWGRSGGDGFDFSDIQDAAME